MLSTYREKQGEEGFTLIELLVVIIIIGILAAIAIPTFLGQRERARRGAVQSDLRNAAIEAETYFTDNNTYTDFTDATTWDSTPTDGVTLTVVSTSANDFCMFGTFTDADNNNGLPDADGGGWYYSSAQSPQLYPNSDPDTGGGC